jgi:hypothetical protein
VAPANSGDERYTPANYGDERRASECEEWERVRVGRMGESSVVPFIERGKGEGKGHQGELQWGAGCLQVP